MRPIGESVCCATGSAALSGTRGYVSRAYIRHDFIQHEGQSFLRRLRSPSGSEMRRIPASDSAGISCWDAILLLFFGDREANLAKKAILFKTVPLLNVVLGKGVSPAAAEMFSKAAGDFLEAPAFTAAPSLALEHPSKEAIIRQQDRVRRARPVFSRGSAGAAPFRRNRPAAAAAAAAARPGPR